jgi:hypothetical protein
MIILVIIGVIVFGGILWKVISIGIGMGRAAVPPERWNTQDLSGLHGKSDMAQWSEETPAPTRHRGYFPGT